MKLNQKSYGNNGKQNLLFPLSFMQISQGEYESYSHSGILAIDFLGWDQYGRVYRHEFYSPCDLKCVSKNDSVVVWNSINEVNFIDGSSDYCFVVCIHDNNSPNFTVGEIKNQGQVLGHTGTAGNVTGDHLHLVVGRGHYQGGYYNEYNAFHYNNSDHIYNLMGINNTIKVNDYGYNWKLFDNDDPGPTPIKNKKNNFNWVLFGKVKNR